MSAPAGIDPDRLTAYLADRVGLSPPVSFSLLAGGHSNLTFAVEDSTGRRVVLRRPPVSHVLQSAHDMGREYRLCAALAPTAVPVPPVLCLCEDPAVNGAPFYVMALVEGHVLRDGATAEAALTPAARRRASEQLVDGLVALHDLDVDEVGLGDLARRDGYVARQLKRWHGQFLRSTEALAAAGASRPAPLVLEVHEALSRRIPPEGPSRLVHGDYRLDNAIVGDDGTLRAVLDWELCTLGEPLADLGTLCMYWTEAADLPEGSPRPATAVEGFATRAELVARYEQSSGRDCSALPYYLAFAHWRLACIVEGVHVRYATGAMGDQRGAAALFGEMVLSEAEKARDCLAAW